MKMNKTFGILAACVCVALIFVGGTGVTAVAAIGEMKQPRSNDKICGIAILKLANSSLVKDAQDILMREEPLSVREIEKYRPSLDSIISTKQILENLGFETKIINKNLPVVVIIAPKKVFEHEFNTKLEQKTLKTPTMKEGLVCYQPMAPIKIPPQLQKHIETIIFPPPPIFFQSPDPPPLPYYHLIPDEVAEKVNATPVHLEGYNGSGIKLSMIDTGFYPHPYYEKRGYDIEKHATYAWDDPEVDQVGHGTAIASNSLSTAPGVKFIFIKLSGNFAVPIALYQATEVYDASIITNSYGYPEEVVLYYPRLWPYFALIRLVIDYAIEYNNNIVLFACGNGGIKAWPSSLPEVLSIGGVYIDQAGDLQASNYSSSFDSIIYTGRHCPDLCGVVGQQPHGILIEMPTQPGSYLDRAFSQYGDGTTENDGWLVASGTSSATPQVAGVIALLKQKKPELDIIDIKEILEQTATDVTKGQSANGDQAGPGWDPATGYGLVDAYEAFTSISEKKVLFDETHNECARIDYTGEYYWEDDMMFVGYSKFANVLRDQGYTVEKLTTGPITSDILKDYNILVLAAPQESIFSEGEKQAILQFVQEGGGLLLIGEHGGYSLAHNINSAINPIAENFGIEFKEDIILDPTNNDGDVDYWPIIHEPYLADHPINDDVKQYVLLAACSLSVSAPAEEIAWGDEDSYIETELGYSHTGAIPKSLFSVLHDTSIITDETSIIKVVGDIPVFAAAEYGKGKVVCVGDVDLWDNVDPDEDGIPDIEEYDNKKLGINIMGWLVDPKSSQLTFEIFHNRLSISPEDTCVVNN